MAQRSALDAGKKTGGRKRHVLVDTLGMILGVRVTSAAVQARDGAVMLLASLYMLFGKLQIIWADGGYAGALVAWVKGLRPFDKLHLDIARRSDDAKGFQLVKKRWIVKRTLRHRSGQPPRQRWTQRQLKRQDVAGWR